MAINYHNKIFAKEYDSTADNMCLLKKYIIQKGIKLNEENVISGSNLETIKKRIKFFEANDPNGVILRLLKQQISNNVSEKDKA